MRCIFALSGPWWWPRASRYTSFNQSMQAWVWFKILTVLLGLGTEGPVHQIFTEDTHIKRGRSSQEQYLNKQSQSLLFNISSSSHSFHFNLNMLSFLPAAALVALSWSSTATAQYVAIQGVTDGVGSDGSRPARLNINTLQNDPYAWYVASLRCPNCGSCIWSAVRAATREWRTDSK